MQNSIVFFIQSFSSKCLNVINMKGLFNYHLIKPEVLVGLGDETIFGYTNDEVHSLHMNIEDWLGDDLLT